METIAAPRVALRIKSINICTSFSTEPEAWEVLTISYHCDSETVLGPGTFRCSAAVLAPGHTSPPATKYKETIWD